MHNLSAKFKKEGMDIFVGTIVKRQRKLTNTYAVGILISDGDKIIRSKTISFDAALDKNTLEGSIESILSGVD